MSNGGNIPGQQPIVIQQPVSWLDRGLKIGVIVAIIGATIFVGTLKKQGKLSDEDAAAAVQLIKTYGPMLMAKRPDSEGPGVEVKAKDGTVIVKPLAASAPAADGFAFGPEDLDKWLPLVDRFIAVLKPVIEPKPAPTPLPGPTPSEQALLDQIKQLQDAIAGILKPPAPTPVVPVPTPVVPVPVPNPVVPQPDVGKIVVTDETGKTITAATVEPGVLFQVSSTIPAANAGWTVSRNGDVRLVTLPGNGGFVCYLNPGAWVEFHLTDYGSRQQFTLRITCNQGPQPPPKPVDPVPTVDVKPTPKPATELRVLVVYESSQNHSAKQDLILSSVVSGKINDALNAKCSKATDGRPNWRRWDKDIVYDASSPMGTLFSSVVEAAKSKGLPAVVVACGDNSTVFPIPADASEDSVIAVLTCGAN